ncbi:MAG: phosphonoacetaldehyde hydrolase [Naasia sp.]|jgi:hypothetical protein|uniref:DUF4245 domain-containing protein n=1 Tax=Naasia sp. TaxID=2546198 RepID=UPI00261E773D|nr:DUF4245 domain-containing protein [Naasia sp.]MCU1569401.1 phosphonoacetaldehyde hydrolase [Naasia sp.]
MSDPARPPRVVAELGRPETAEETAARKEEDRRKRRGRQTVNNLWYSLLVTVGVVVVIILLVPRGAQDFAPNVDYPAAAQEAQGAVDQPLAVPEPGKQWRSNAAQLRTETADGVVSWYIGFLTPRSQYLGFSQGIDANESWLVQLLDGARADGTVTLGGLEWTVYDDRASGAQGNVSYALSTTTATAVYAVYGTADPDEAAALATAVAQSISKEQAG